MLIKSGVLIRMFTDANASVLCESATVIQTLKITIIQHNFPILEDSIAHDIFIIV